MEDSTYGEQVRKEGDEINDKECYGGACASANTGFTTASQVFKNATALKEKNIDNSADASVPCSSSSSTARDALASLKTGGHKRVRESSVESEGPPASCSEPVTREKKMAATIQHLKEENGRESSLSQNTASSGGDSMTSLSNASSGSRFKKHEYPICGVCVKFPFKPYPQQFSIMQGIIKACKGSVNALVESPTGTGKTLALLCSAVGYQKALFKNECCRYETQIEDRHYWEHLFKEWQSEPRYDNKDSILEGAEAMNVEATKILREGLAKNSEEDDLAVTKKDEKTMDIPCVIALEDDSDDFQTDLKVKIIERKIGNYSEHGGHKCVRDDEEDVRIALQKRIEEVQKTELIEMFLKSSHCKESDVEQVRSCLTGRTKLESPTYVPIIYCTRTQGQVNQVVQELKRSGIKDVNMALLGSREFLCIHPKVMKSSNKNEECRNKTMDGKCEMYNNTVKRRDPTGNLIFARGNKLALHDMEDLVELGKEKDLCPYFLSHQTLESRPNILICPYNYVLDPIFREKSKVNIDDAIVIIDEAHNVESVLRDSASLTLSDDALNDAKAEMFRFIQAHELGDSKYEDMFRKIGILLDSTRDFIASSISKLRPSGYKTKQCKRKSEEFKRMIYGHGFEHEDVKILKSKFKGLIEEKANEALQYSFGAKKSEVLAKASFGQAACDVIVQLLVAIQWLKTCPSDDYVLIIDEKLVSYNKFSRKKFDEEEHLQQTVSFSCLNSGVAFHDLKKQTRSVILASGTLTPVWSFGSELQCEFPIHVEAGHVAKPAQISSHIVAVGPSGKEMKGVYQTLNTSQYQDDCGNIVLHAAQNFEGGVLVFFPSYSAMSTVTKRWGVTGVYGQIEQYKVICEETRSSNKQDFKDMFQEFTESVHKRDEMNTSGAVLLAVCRGKVSEGVDFTDDLCRAVILFGIPFPNFKDVLVESKQQYNDRAPKDRKMCTGRTWYEIQGFRALNQALGRCIRHKNDWGSIILAESRFLSNPAYFQNLPKWVKTNTKNQFVQYHSIIDELKAFSLRWADSPPGD
eukprot:Nk52_evm4s148 gene=Nk52_evmTU4s148